MFIRNPKEAVGRYLTIATAWGCVSFSVKCFSNYLETGGVDWIKSLKAGILGGLMMSGISAAFLLILYLIYRIQKRDIKRGNGKNYKHKFRQPDK